MIAPFYGTHYGTIPPRGQAGIRCIGAENSGIRWFWACDLNRTRLAAGAVSFCYYAARLRLARMAAGRERVNGRNHKLGESGCEENTVVGTVALHWGRRAGDSIFDPVFVLAAVLEWAGIAENGRSELILTAEYKARL